MKRKVISFVLDVMLTLMLVAGLMKPESVAVNFVVAWAWLGCALMLTAVTTGMAGHVIWYVFEKGKVPDAESQALKAVRAIFNPDISPLRRWWSWAMFAAIVVCLINAGWLVVAIVYLFCAVAFRFTASVYRQLMADAPCTVA
ncbi:DNZ54_00345 family protein [Atlantibacter hermannii]|uniref:DNZ54_00345 family protein n=1 Tax=Atlantibacter hermannii TaxID=565 RepID=UPI002FDD69A6